MRFGRSKEEFQPVKPVQAPVVQENVPGVYHGHGLLGQTTVAQIYYRVSGQVPKFYWDSVRQQYLTKDGLTMAQVAAANQAARRARVLS